MKIMLVFLFSLLFYSCSSKKYCTSANMLELKVDTTRPYNVSGRYCVSSIVDASINNESAAVQFAVLDRISGKSIKDGVVWLIKNDTTKIKYNQRYSDLGVGRYTVFVSNADNLPLKIKNFNIEEKNFYTVTCYLGSSMQW